TKLSTRGKRGELLYVETAGHHHTRHVCGDIADRVTLSLSGHVDECRVVEHVTLPERGANPLADSSPLSQVWVQGPVRLNHIWNVVPQRCAMGGKLWVRPEIVDVDHVYRRQLWAERPRQSRRERQPARKPGGEK